MVIIICFALAMLFVRQEPSAASNDLHSKVTLVNTTEQGMFMLPVTDQARLYLQRNCGSCHEPASVSVSTEPAFDDYFAGWSLLEAETALREWFKNPQGDVARDEGIYLLRMLSKHSNKNKPKTTWKDEVLNFYLALLKKIGLSAEGIDNKHGAAERTFVAFKKLEVLETFFGLKELRAAQGGIHWQ